MLIYRLLLAAVFSFSVFSAQAMQNSPVSEDIQKIRSFAGCFSVSFDFAETFPLKADYQLRPPYHASALEWVEVDTETSSGITLQHVLLTSEGPQKHWRQVWEYEPASALKYRGNSVWEREALARTDGQWLQRVFQVDDSPRYECSAPWVKWIDAMDDASGEVNYWECQTWSPLPRREITKRSDYNVLERRNRQQLTSSGWVHEEDNTKLVVDLLANPISVAPLVKEKGMNIYRRVSDSQCADGQSFWRESRIAWHAIQAAWGSVYATHERLHIQRPAGEPQLWEALFELAEDAVKEKRTAALIESDARAIIGKYLQ